MNQATRDFYKEQSQQWRGPWQIQIPADVAADMTNRLLSAVGEPPVKVSVITEGDFHQAFPEHIEYLAMEITPLIVIHETAHVIQSREEGWYGAEHDECLWMMMGVLEQIFMELL